LDRLPQDHALYLNPPSPAGAVVDAGFLAEAVSRRTDEGRADDLEEGDPTDAPDALVDREAASEPQVPEPRRVTTVGDAIPPGVATELPDAPREKTDHKNTARETG
jgi:hypothetical protein